MKKKRILLLTVGGSLAPLVTSIKQLQPDFATFICSEDTETPGSYTQIPDILQEVGGIEHEKILVSPDGPEDCIGKIMGKVESLRKENPDAEIMADYTGGTKTMSASLFWVAIHQNLQLFLTTGLRRDLIAVVEGETTRRLPLSFPYYEELLENVDSLLKRFDYASAGEMFHFALANYPFSPDEANDLQRKLEIVEIFRLWDVYDHLGAFRRAQPYRKALWKDYMCFWDKVIGDRMKMEEDFKKEVEERKINIVAKDAPTKYAVVQDLLLNGERCAKRERYDDATARLYRAVEVLAQIRLFTKYGINSSNLDINKIPEDKREKYERKKDREGKIKLGLFDDYELLYDFGDEVGKKFKEGDVRGALERRNQSILAHGFKSINGKDYKKIKEKIEGFIKGCLRELLGEKYGEPKQLPSSLEEIEKLLEA